MLPSTSRELVPVQNKVAHKEDWCFSFNQHHHWTNYFKALMSQTVVIQNNIASQQNLLKEAL